MEETNNTSEQVYPTDEIKRLNRRIEGKYGADLTGRAKFRLSRAGDHMETMKGDFVDLDNNAILIRRVNEVRRKPKYDHIDPDCIILERLNDGQPPPNIDLGTYSKYELLYAFKKKDGSNQYVTAWRPVEFLIEMTLSGWNKGKIWKTAKDFAKDMQDQKTKEAELFFEILDNDNPYMATMLANKEAVTVPDMSNLPLDPFNKSKG